MKFFQSTTPHSAQSYRMNRHWSVSPKDRWSLMSLIRLNIERQKQVFKVFSSVTCLQTLHEWGLVVSVGGQPSHQVPLCAGTNGDYTLTHSTECFHASRQSLRSGSTKQQVIHTFNSLQQPYFTNQEEVLQTKFLVRLPPSADNCQLVWRFSK